MSAVTSLRRPSWSSISAGAHRLVSGWAAVEQRWPGRSLPDVPCTYVLCTEDNILPPARQRELAARLGVEPVEIAADHAVFALRPRELAGLLVG